MPPFKVGSNYRTLSGQNVRIVSMLNDLVTLEYWGTGSIEYMNPQDLQALIDSAQWIRLPTGSLPEWRSGGMTQTRESRPTKGQAVLSLKVPWEKLNWATLAMARDTRSLQIRLANAYLGAIVNIDPDKLPQELRQAVSALHAELSRFNTSDLARDRGLIDDARALELIEDIVTLYDVVTRAYARE